MRLTLFQQIHHSESVHSDPEKLKKKILTQLGGDTSAADPVERMLQRARDQKMERDALAG